jgi:TonB-dependent SusC/RagA subfamily outer membrane receptor
MRLRWILIVLACLCGASARAQQRTITTDSTVLTAPVGTLSELLNGRVPGLVVSSSDGSTGAGASVSVRGGGQPLLLIDGVRADNDPGLHNPAAPDHPAPARFDDLDPSEIAKIEILPGPSATALYGPDAGDGVILVTTKHAS